MLAERGQNQVMLVKILKGAAARVSNCWGLPGAGKNLITACRVESYCFIAIGAAEGDGKE